MSDTDQPGDPEATQPISTPEPAPAPSGPSTPAPSAPSATSGGGGRGTEWWKILLAIGVTAVLAATLVLVLTRDGDGDDEALVEVFREPIGDVGPDPFTEPVAPEPAANISAYAEAEPPPGEGAAEIASVSGGEPGLYGGTRDVASCDAAQLVTFLEENPDKAEAWAEVQGIETSAIGEYIDGLTSMVVPADTRVTNHGFRDGRATPRQSVLQTGTAVLVDESGVPRVRCFCGNPLLPPQAADEGVEYTGEEWSTFEVESLRVVAEAAEPVERFVLTDVETGEPFVRPAGSDGSEDAEAPAGAGEGEGEGEEGLSGPLVATGPMQFPDTGGATITTNVITLRFPAEGGEVSGDATVTSSIGGVSGSVSVTFTGTYEADTGALSGSWNATSAEFGGASSGSWTAQFDTDAGTLTGSIAAGGGTVSFSLPVTAG